MNKENHSNTTVNDEKSTVIDTNDNEETQSVEDFIKNDDIESFKTVNSPASYLSNDNTFKYNDRNTDTIYESCKYDNGPKRTDMGNKNSKDYNYHDNESSEFQTGRLKSYNTQSMKKGSNVDFQSPTGSQFQTPTSVNKSSSFRSNTSRSSSLKSKPVNLHMNHFVDFDNLAAQIHGIM